MRERILVVDDESGITETLSAILRLKGYDVEIATDGEEGYAKAIALKPALVISDISMPRLNGIDMAIKLAAAMPGVRILLFSGQAMTLELLQQARAQGYDFECLVKPFHPIDLLNKVRSLLASRGPSLAGFVG
jgi:DNA-binding response OmpR family regulator